KKWFVARFSTSRRFLFAVGSDGAATLKEIARHVEPRDPDNVEARAVRFYWSRLFTEFRRDDPGFQDVGPLATTTGKSVGKPRLLPKCCHTHAQPTTGKSVGKPRRRNTNPQQTCEPTTRKSVGKPASQMRIEAEVGPARVLPCGHGAKRLHAKRESLLGRRRECYSFCKLLAQRSVCSILATAAKKCDGPRPIAPT